MRAPPKMPMDIGRTIYDWIYDPDSLPQRYLDDLVEFYDELNIKHDNVEYYRGIKVSQDGTYDFLLGGVLKLKNRGIESWSCKYETAESFMPRTQRILNNYESGILLSRKIPAKSVLFNINQIGAAYSYVFDEENIGVYFDEDGYNALLSIYDHNECELVTETVCTKCSIEDMVQIKFMYHNGYDDIIDDFFRLFKLDSKSKQNANTIKFGNVITMSRYGNSWKLELNK